MTVSLSADDFAGIRAGLAELARADNLAPGATVNPAQMVIALGHRAALDPERALVVGNRGMGKSFWAHALADKEAREKAAKSIDALVDTDVLIGFNASERTHPIMPTPAALQEALGRVDDPAVLWRAVLVRVAHAHPIDGAPGAPLPGTFGGVVAWVQSNAETAERMLTALDDQLVLRNRRLVVVFDALDRLGSDWKTTRVLTSALLKRALAVRSYRALRLKLFMRRDQFEDPVLFEFPDGSKIRNTRVELTWSSNDLYALLFARLSQSALSAAPFSRLTASSSSTSTLLGVDLLPTHKALVDAIAGEYMGAGKKRGRVYTWLPLHLSDARGETSPRTFLTAWREAAHHSPSPTSRAVDPAGLLEGVRKASEDRLQELVEDYWWIRTALAPLREHTVPMERVQLEELWRKHNTATTIREQSSSKDLAPIQLEDGVVAPESSLVAALVAIGIIEIRSNGKINVPDIFRVEAGIKRRGGVKPPKRSSTERS